MNWEPPGEFLSVQYMSGEEEESRLEGTANRIPVVLFLISCAALGWYGYKVWMMAHEAVHGGPKRHRLSSRR